MDSFGPTDRMAEGFLTARPASAPRVWAVGALVRAVADTLQARFNPATVRGEVSGFSRASSGHCYFSLKDDAAQLRCALFRRSADLLDFVPRDGQLVEAVGKLDVYGPRGDLQFIVERLRPAGQGALLEQFLLLKARLEAEGLFDPVRKRLLPAQPTRIDVVTSLGAAALRDVVSALQRRVPHLPVYIYPAAVQGAQAPAALCAALEAAYARHTAEPERTVLLLVRGGGSLEDLWCFNDESLVRMIARAPMPVISGVGHETDFTLADFVADVRAPTPTAAAELCAPTQAARLAELDHWGERLQRATVRELDTRAQRLDRLADRLGRPTGWLQRQRDGLVQLQSRLRHGLWWQTQRHRDRSLALERALPTALAQHLERQRQRLARVEARLGALDPRLVLERGYAWLSDDNGQALTRAAQALPGQGLTATLADGQLPLVVRGPTGVSRPE